jgi:hypothetical protein
MKFLFLKKHKKNDVTGTHRKRDVKCEKKRSVSLHNNNNNRKNSF